MHLSILSVIFAAYIFTLGEATPTHHALGSHLVIRQTQENVPQAPLANDPSCVTYSLTANLSTVGSNSSYRSAFYARSRSGSMFVLLLTLPPYPPSNPNHRYDNRMFSAAIASLPKLTSDVALNSRCGNLTTVALREAERNLTLGTVLQFGGIVPEGIKAGPEVVVIVGGVVLLFFGVWSFMP